MKHQYKTRSVQTADGEVGEVTTGSGNVFADMDLPDAEELQFKCDLAWRISDEIARRGWTQEQAANELAVCRPDVSLIRNRRLSRFTIDRLFGILNRLGQRIDVRVSSAPDTAGYLLKLEPSAPARIAAPGPTVRRADKVLRPSPKPRTRIKVAA